MYNETIINHSKNPFNKFEMEDATISHFEDNDSCGDSLVIYLKIIENKIESWSFTWDVSIIITACASIYWENIIWQNLQEVLELNYDYIENLVWQEIPERRKKPAVLALLTTRNAIHKYLQDWIEDDFDDVMR